MNVRGIGFYAAATRGRYTKADLERLAAVHTPHFAAADLADRLEAVELRDERTFQAYGLDDGQIDEICRWALGWAREIRERPDQNDRIDTVEAADWDAYLDDAD